MRRVEAAIATLALGALALVAACSDFGGGAAAQEDASTAAPGNAALACGIARDYPLPRAETPSPDAVRRTPVTRYTLSLSWSPGFCARDGGGPDNAMQCASDDAARFGFVLHGLWPETDGRDWPQYCAPTRTIARATLDRHLCMTPSPQLLQHEWARHGSCMAATPEAYFGAASRLFAAVAMPDMAALSARPGLTVGDLKSALVAANPALPRDAVAVRTRAGWLEEVHLCLDRRQNYARCPVWQRAAPDGARLRIEPSR